MKRVEAIIKPFKFDDVREALSELGIRGLTVFDSKGYGQGWFTELYRGAEYVVEWVPQVIVIVYIADDQVDVVVETILKAAYTGKFGDGRIAVYNLDNLLRIRTGESGDDAL